MISHSDTTYVGMNRRQRRIRIVTKPLIGTYNESGSVRYWLLGRLDADLDFSDSRDRTVYLRFRNLDVRGEDPHPHIRETPCLGTIGEGLRALYTEGKWIELVDYLLCYFRDLRACPTGPWRELTSKVGEAPIIGQLLAEHPETRNRLNRWLNVGRLENYRVVFVGLGTIGARLAIGVGRLGFPEIWLVDNDRVEVGNNSCQWYLPWHQGQLKVTAVAHELRRFACGENVHPFPIKWGRNFQTQLLWGGHRRTILIVGTDDLPSRREIWGVAKNLMNRGRCDLLIDGRLHGSTGTVFAISRCQSAMRYYDQFGFPEEVMQGGCGANAYAPAAAMIETIVMEGLMTFLNGDPINLEHRFDTREMRQGRTPTIMIEPTREERR